LITGFVDNINPNLEVFVFATMLTGPRTNADDVTPSCDILQRRKICLLGQPIALLVSRHRLPMD
jgi:hypothetical protein